MKQADVTRRAGAAELTSDRVPSPALRRWLPWVISGVILLADRLTKALVLAQFRLGESHPLLPPVVYLTHVQNTGAAFGLFKHQRFIFIGVSVLVIGWLLRELFVRPPRVTALMWSYALVLGGTIGNLIDRVRFGYVVDFIDVRVWPFVFNVGDSAITIGVTLLVWHSLIATRGQRQGP